MTELLLASTFFIACGGGPLNVPNGSDAGSVSSDGSGASSGSGSGIGTSDAGAEAGEVGDGSLGGPGSGGGEGSMGQGGSSSDGSSKAGAADAAGDSEGAASVSPECAGKSCGYECGNGEFPAFCDRHGACVVLLPASSCPDS